MIPKILHHIWFGDKPYPYLEYRDAWITLHPDCKFHLWDDSNIPQNLLKKETLEIISNSKIPPVSKSDSFRFDIVDAMGGVYLDSDMEPLRCINEVFDNDEFIGESVMGGLVGAGIFGSISNGSWIADLSNTINRNILDNLDSACNTKMNVLEFIKICGTSSLQSKFKTCKKIYPVAVFYPDQLPGPDFSKALTRHHWGSAKSDGWILQRFAA
jgi:hypothetical protein